MIGSTQTHAGSSAAHATPHPSPSRSILIVDDECTLRSALRRFFVRRGWRVVEAEDGESARALLLDAAHTAHVFDAVLTDLRMPRMNGMELHEQVARVNAGLARRFIFSSGDTGDEEAVAFLQRTHCPVVSKPFELGHLLSMAEQIADEASHTN